MSIDPKFVELTADVLETFFVKKKAGTAEPRSATQGPLAPPCLWKRYIASKERSNSNR